MTIIHGIKNCGSVKKARAWLEQHAIPYEFHDFKTAGLPEAMLDEWLTEIDWQRLLNTKSATWRQLPPEEKADLDAAKARALLLAHPTLVKRPVLARSGQFLVGFQETEYQTLFPSTESR